MPQLLYQSMLIQAKKLTSFWAKSKGLIGKKIPQNIYFKTRWGIHTFNLKFPIDVVILDSHNNVVVLKENLSPNRIFLWNPKYENVLELKVGSIKKHKIKIGGKIFIAC